LLGAFVVIHAPDTPSTEKSLASEASISMLSALHDNKGRGDDEVAEAMHDDEETETDDERVTLAMHDDEETETDDEMDAADEECKSEMNVEFDPTAATEAECREKTGLHEGKQKSPASPSTTYPHPPSDTIANSSAAGTSPEHDGDVLPPAATDLECSVCGYDLGSEFVSLYEHPTLGVPLCRDCFHDCLADPSESGEEEAHTCAS
jgi:hypothetical protein